MGVLSYENSNSLENSVSAASSRSAGAAGTRHALGDYGGHFARLLVLLGSFFAGWLLNHLSAVRPYFGFLVVTGVILVCIGLVLGPQTKRASTRVAVSLFDLGWIMFAMYLTDGLSSFLLPLLYVVVAAAAVRGNRWEMGTTVAGAITGIFILASTNATGANLSLGVAQATLLAAGALAVRLTATAGATDTTETRDTDKLYEALLSTTSDAIFSLDPDDWTIREANPAATRLFGAAGDGGDLVGSSLEKVLAFRDHAFPQTCREKLAKQEEVRDAVTFGQGGQGETLVLRFNLLPALSVEGFSSVQAIVEITQEQAAIRPAAPPRRDDFSVNYIPSLTHELNNHLAAIRLSAELAATTGRAPDYEQMQQQVDHCQDVLQTVVLQILRASVPVQATGETPASDLRTVIERCLLLTRPQVLTNGIQLQVNLPAELPAVAGFTYELQEALVRVLIQSVKAMAVQEPPRTLSLSVMPHEHELELLIVDTSGGLNSRELTVTNGRYTAVSRAEDRNWEVVRDAVCRFGGLIHASNGLNGGMRLKINLPLIAQAQEASA